MQRNQTALFPDLEDELNGPPPELVSGGDVVVEGTMRSWAIFSADRVYRYLLGRCWETLQPWLVVGMLNPSKAGAAKSDPTITRLLGFARRDHFGGLLVWNACALVATNPRELLIHPDPVGPRNREAIEAACGAPILAKVVVGWGRPLNRRIAQLVERARAEATVRRMIYRFGEPTKEGYPRHPLYIRADTPIVEHRPRCW